MNNDFENRNENMENVPNTAVPNEMPAEAVQAPEAAAAVPHSEFFLHKTATSSLSFRKDTGLLRAFRRIALPHTDAGCGA